MHTIVQSRKNQQPPAKARPRPPYRKAYSDTFPKCLHFYLENSLIDVDILHDEPNLDALCGFDAKVKPTLLGLLVLDIRDRLEYVLPS